MMNPKAEAVLTILANLASGLLLSTFFALIAALIVVDPHHIASWLREAF
jgi:hypothetical protein